MICLIAFVAVVVVIVVACDEVVSLGRHADDLLLRIAVVRRDGREVAVGSLDEAASNLFLAVCSESKQCTTKISIVPRKCSPSVLLGELPIVLGVGLPMALLKL